MPKRVNGKTMLLDRQKNKTYVAISSNLTEPTTSMQAKRDSHDEGMDLTGSLRQMVSVLLLWTISLLPAVPTANAETLSFLDGRIRLYPAQREGDRILIPFAQPPAPDEEVLLLYRRTDLYHLSRVQKETIMPKAMAHPRPHYVYGLTEGRLLDPQAQFLVAVGKGIPSLLKWKAADAMSSDQSASSCMTPEKGFVITGLQVLISEELNAKVYYLQEEILQSTPNMMIDEDDNSGISMKEIVGMVESEDSCRVLAYNTSDAYGLQNNGSLEPVGPISGIMELSTGRSTERWLVLRSAMREVWGYTFIELSPRPLNHEPKRRFLLEDRG
ncbi:MAG: hypothetical protein AB7F94_17500 [Nitrospira sp.]